MVREWDPLQQDPVIVWERSPGELVVTSGHHRVTAARIRTERGIDTPVDYVIKDFDASDIAEIRRKARRSNKGTVKESPVDIAHQVKSLSDENPDLTDAQLAKQVDRRVGDIKEYRNLAYLPDALKRAMNAGFDFKAGRFTNGFMFKQKAGAALGEQIRLGRIDGAAAQDFHARYEGAGLSTDEFVEKVRRNIGLMAEKVDVPEAGTLFNVGDFGSATYARIDAIDDQIVAEKRKLKAEQGTLKKANKLDDTSPAERKRNEGKIARRQKAIDALERKYQKAMDQAAKTINAAPPNPTNVVPASTLDVPSVMDDVADAPTPPNGAAKPVTLPARIRNMPEAVSGPDDPAVNGSAFSKADDPATPVTVSNQALFLDARAKADADARRMRQQHVAWIRHSNDGVRGMLARERIKRAHRPLPRIDRVTETGNTGYLFGEALGWQEEVFLTKNKLADGTTLLDALESYKYQYMRGKSVMWPADAESLVAVQQELADATPEQWRPAEGTLLVGGCWVCFPRGLTGRGGAGDPAWAAAVVVRDGKVVLLTGSPGGRRRTPGRRWFLTSGRTAGTGTSPSCGARTSPPWCRCRCSLGGGWWACSTCIPGPPETTETRISPC